MKMGGLKSCSGNGPMNAQSILKWQTKRAAVAREFVGNPANFGGLGEHKESLCPTTQVKDTEIS